jgi:hypothetical protein
MATPATQSSHSLVAGVIRWLRIWKTFESPRKSPENEGSLRDGSPLKRGIYGIAA